MMPDSILDSTARLPSPGFCGRTFFHVGHDFIFARKRYSCAGVTDPENVTLVVNRDVAERLVQAWENTVSGSEGRAVALGDLFEGQDGLLHQLNAALDREH